MNTFKVDRILFVVSRANEIVYWMVRDFISRETNLNTNKTEYMGY